MSTSPEASVWHFLLSRTRDGWTTTTTVYSDEPLSEREAREEALSSFVPGFWEILDAWPVTKAGAS